MVFVDCITTLVLSMNISDLKNVSRVELIEVGASHQVFQPATRAGVRLFRLLPIRAGVFEARKVHNGGSSDAQAIGYKVPAPMCVMCQRTTTVYVRSFSMRTNTTVVDAVRRPFSMLASPGLFA